MRRIIMALFAMTVGIVLLVGLKSQQLAVPLGLVTVEPVDPEADAGNPGLAGGPEPTGSARPSGATPSADASGAPTASPEVTVTPGPAPTTATTTTAPAPPPTPSGVSGTFTGTAVAVKTAQSPNTRSRPCGDCDSYSMSVTITVSGGRITDVSVAYSPNPSASRRYANKATNALRPKILSAQTWRLGNVSGATYSANAFELSAQDAMAKAGLPT